VVERRLADLAVKMGGTILQGSPATIVRGAQIDSRQLDAGELFFAIVAARDGHDFVGDAATRGAAGAVVSREVRLADPAFPLVRVADTAEALGRLAAAVLAERFLPVVGITGSVGKTTTKEFTAALLGSRYKVLKSEGNYNNRFGLALSLLGLEPGHEAAVLEMGMSAPGEIRRLIAIAPPDVAVITNIGPVHLEFLKTMENVAAAKREILEGMKPGGVAVLNGDDPFCEKISQDWPGRKIHFGLSRACDVRAENVRRLGFGGFKFDLVYRGATRRLRVPFLSDNLIANLLAAFGVAEALALPYSGLEGRLGDLRPIAHRGTLLRLKNGVLVIDDAYNSNPRALESALRNYGALPAGRKLAVLGDMLELGDAAIFFHEEAGGQAARTGWDLLMTVGPLGERIADGARGAGMTAGRIRSFPTSQAAADALPEFVREGDLILVKGSHGIRMDLIVESLKERLKET
jgi:UDP-N-acetylmuramoyl-tripeptide--D-alanyl-D-alanine ligase